MSVIADDIIKFTSILKMSFNFLAGRDFLKKKKFREKKKLVSIALPFSDLVFASGAIPTVPIRMEIFDINRYLIGMNSATNFFGWNNVARFLGFVKQFDLLRVTDNIIAELIESVNSKYNEMCDLGTEKGISSDFCYGLKALVGMHISKGKNIDANFNVTVRCSAWNKYLESLKIHCPQAKQIWMEVPPRNIGNAEELLKENISQAISELEDLTGNIVTDNSLRKQFRIRNQIVRYYKTILYEISVSDFYPCHPTTFTEILGLLSTSFQDYNSDVMRYLNNISQLVQEMRKRIRRGIGMDCSNMSRILVTPIFGGWETYINEFLSKMGARAIYADWDILGFLEEVDISGDPIEGYAKFLLDIGTTGIGCDNSTLTDSYIRTAKKLKVDGIVFNQVFGCHSLSNCYTLLKDKTRRMELPTIAIHFNKIGENLEQVKTRLGAFIEIVNHKQLFY